MRTSRRSFLAAAGTLSALTALPPAASVAGDDAVRTRLVLLGTAGGPRPRKTRSASAQAIVVGGAIYIADCGDGVARQMVDAGLALNAIRGVFITHHHSDHNADYGNLLLLAWTGGLRTPVDTFGPPPLEKMTRLFLEMNEVDISTRMADEKRVPLAPLIRAHDIAAPGTVFEDERVKVTAALVDHPPMNPAFAYRFDSADRSIVISGDTKYSQNLIALAKGADVLVHEAIYPESVDRLVRNVANAPDLKRSILSHHTAAEDVGRVAAAAGVQVLVLSHLIPAEDPQVTEQMWLDAVAKHFKGKVVVGSDLATI
ncbi:MAG: MBL fold metallo-hydrolase [Pseudomonadota bacterium]